MKGLASTGALRLGCCALAVLSIGWGASRAAAKPACGLARPESVRPRPWPAPLDRRVSLDLRNLPLRTALDRVAAAARLRLSYLDELLPLTRPVCGEFRDVTAGDALVSLLAGARVAPISAGGDHVILAPRAVEEDTANPPPRDPVPLPGIVVTGTRARAGERASSVGVVLIGRRELAQQHGATMSEILDAEVPGMWLWPSSPGNVLASWGSLRGASSFGSTAPKVYLDGVQVSPLLVSQLDPDDVERIEVIRGPEGAALYGSDALNGVVDIRTRNESVAPGAPHTRIRSEMGMTESAFAPGGVLTQTHAVGVGAGSERRSAALDLTLGSSGAYVPGAADRHVEAFGRARFVGNRSIVTAMARVFSDDGRVPYSPLLRDAVASTAAAMPVTRGPANTPFGMRADSGALPQSLREYTLGATASLMPDDHWTHTLTAGFDGYRLTGDPSAYAPGPGGAAELGTVPAAADRGTLRLTSVGRFGDPDHMAGTVTLGAEQSLLRESTSLLTQGSAYLGARAASLAFMPWQYATAGMVQAQGSLLNTFFVTAGLRAERDAGRLLGDDAFVLPMFGVALARDAGPVTVKLRAAYGRGIRLPDGAVVAGPMDDGGLLSSASLQPARQSGVEAGFDLLFGDGAALHVTRYVQQATGLVQRVAVPTGFAGTVSLDDPDDASRPASSSPQVAYTFESLGAIANRGWELQGTTHVAGLSLSGTLAYTDSRVAQVAPGYAGDLRPGDRALGVPAWTGSLGASWTLAGWSASVTGYRAYDWIGYDRLALARTRVTAGPGAPTGSALRAFWQRYDGATHLRATASRPLGRGFSLLLTGDNLLGQQTGEPDDVTVLPGRTFSLGIRAAF